MTKIQKTTTVSLIKARFETASCFGSPAIFKQKNGGYGIRIVTKSSFNNRSGTVNTSYDYFEMDSDGKIISSPRWLAKEFNWTVVTDIKNSAL